ncbi:MAG TPA: hypothetical protein VEK37_03455 [Gemmatimonadaceae bacterium]|nr:hypothetical protein [Gemmatimonadaceae bacterium]
MLTVEELLNGKQLDYPRTAGINVTTKAAPRVVREDAQELHLFWDQPHQAASPKTQKKKRR